MRNCCASSAMYRTISAGCDRSHCPVCASLSRSGSRGVVHAHAERAIRAAHKTKALVERLATVQGNEGDRRARPGASIEIFSDKLHQRVAVSAAAILGIDDQIGEEKVQDAVTHHAGESNQAIIVTQAGRE